MGSPGDPKRHEEKSEAKQDRMPMASQAPETAERYVGMWRPPQGERHSAQEKSHCVRVHPQQNDSAPMGPCPQRRSQQGSSPLQGTPASPFPSLKSGCLGHMPLLHRPWRGLGGSLVTRGEPVPSPCPLLALSFGVRHCHFPLVFLSPSGAVQ